MIARRMKRHLDSAVVRLSGVEALIGKDVEIIVLEEMRYTSQISGRKRVKGTVEGDCRGGNRFRFTRIPRPL